MYNYENKNNAFIFYQKSDYFGKYSDNDTLKLYRVRKINEERIYSRREIFHTPFSKRATISTCRYSIAGYPCLYLGTSIELCRKETEISRKKNTLVSMFQIERNAEINHINIEVLDLAIKPTDFSIDRIRKFDDVDLDNINAKKSYLQLYPLIAACSIIAKCKKDPFVPEYIIPQLLMQWLRNKNDTRVHQSDSVNYSELCGIRYFSCRSIKAAEKDYNYVFPVCINTCSERNDGNNIDYCNILSNAFKFTLPVILSHYQSDEECEEALDLKERELLST